MKFKMIYALLFITLVLYQNISAIPVDSDDKFILQPMIPGSDPVRIQTKSDQKPVDCECILFHLCANIAMDINGKDLMEVRHNERPHCPNLYEVCCPTASIKSQKRQIREIKQNATVVEKAKKCGTRNVDGIGFHLSGTPSNEAQYGEFPWTAVVLYKNPKKPTLGFKLRCGASLIHPQVVMTSAVCVSDTNITLLKIRVGEWDLQTTTELYAHQDMEIKKIVIHENFEPYKNDIALVFLKEAVKIAANVDTICLPEANSNFANDTCLVTGWGAPDAVGLNRILKVVELPIVPRENCLKLLNQVDKSFKVHESFICAGGKSNEDSCKGDGGGPLFCPIKGEKNRYQQVGIVSHGLGCAKANVPALYSDVSHFRIWIEEQMKLDNLVL